jgi:hypothetical protein
MQTIKNRRWMVLAGLALAFSILGLHFTSGTAYADYGDDVQGCTYTFTTDESAIKRTDCSPKADLTFSQDGSNYVETSDQKHCKQTIKPEAGKTSGTLSGQYEDQVAGGKFPVFGCVSFSSVNITITAPDGGSVSTGSYVATITHKLDSLISKHCKGDDRILNHPCRTKYNFAIATCVNEVVPQIKDSDKNKNQKFSDLFSACLAKATQATKHEISVALGDKIWDDLQTGLTADEDAGEANDDIGCEGSGALSWALCAAINGLQDLVGGLYDNVIQPLLITKPLSTADDNETYKAWKNFRVYGDIFLVIGILVIVFGESIGGGLIDAYTAKKVLPRLLIAAVLINLSFYIVAVLVDVMNIVGKGTMDLITAPFGLTGDFTLDLGIGGGVGLAGILTSALIFTAVGVSGQFLSWLFFIILLPMALVMLAILATVLIRHALIIFLVIISPFAFALYCLPNTEKYFRQWWDILFKTLLVFPIIAALFAMGKVSAHLLSTLDGNVLTGGISDIIAVVALFVPLLLIPFAFRIAGGVMGRAFDAFEGMRARGHKFTEGTRQRIGTQAGKNRIQSRAKYYSKVQGQVDKAQGGGFIRRNTLGRGFKGLNAVVGGYNIEAAMSAARADTGKIMNDQINTGKDDEIRGLSVNKQWALGTGQILHNKKDADGKVIKDAKGDAVWYNSDDSVASAAQRESSQVRIGADGGRKFKTLGGAYIGESDVDKGHARWGNDTFAQQTSLAYEMRKAQSEGQLANLSENYHNVAQGDGGWGMNDEQAGGAWIGGAFEHQGIHLENKYTDWETGKLRDDGKGYVDELYEKKGSYNVAQMGSRSIERLKEAHQLAVASGDVDTQEKIAAVAETFMHQMGTGAGASEEERAAAAAAGTPLRMASTPGAAHVAERVHELAVLTGVFGTAPDGGYSDPGHAPTPNQRKQ